MQATAPKPLETLPANGRPAALAIRDFPSGERPRERLSAYGPSSLSNAELMAILLRTGLKGENVLVMAQRLLRDFGGLDELARASVHDLCAEKGISSAKACQLLAGIELGKRVASPDPMDRPYVNSPEDIANMLSPEMAYLSRECFKVILLNIKNQVIEVEKLYVGSVNSSIVRTAEVYASALKRNCPSIAVAHNHPSGDPTPSSDDIATTSRLVKAGRLLEVELIDHVIIGRGRFISMRDCNLGFD